MKASFKYQSEHTHKNTIEMEFFEFAVLMESYVTLTYNT